MREWKFENGIEVYEKGFDYDLHAFDVYRGDEYLGDITPDSIESMKSIIAGLDSGDDPISGHWEDGGGNSCSDWNTCEIFS